MSSCLETSCDETGAAVVENGAKIRQWLPCRWPYTKTGGIIPKPPPANNWLSLPVLKKLCVNTSKDPRQRRDINAIAPPLARAWLARWWWGEALKLVF